MKEMSPEEVGAFLASGTRTAKLATVRADGSPHVAPVWFVPDGDVVVFMTWHESVKGRSLLRDGRTTLIVDDETFPYSFVMIEGTATTSTGEEDRRRWSRRIAERYVPSDLVDEYAERNAVEGELVVRVVPRRVVARAAMAV